MQLELLRTFSLKAFKRQTFSFTTGEFSTRKSEKLSSLYVTISRGFPLQFDCSLFDAVFRLSSIEKCAWEKKEKLLESFLCPRFILNVEETTRPLVIIIIIIIVVVVLVDSFSFREGNKDVTMFRQLASISTVSNS